MMGKYFIPPEHADIFYKLYLKSFKKGEVLALTEVHEELSPIIIDIDFRFNESIGIERVYTKNDIINIIKIYNEQINTYFDINEEQIHSYMFEKSSPVRHQGNIKDGIHIIYPKIISKPDVQYEIRENVIKIVKQSQCLSHLKYKNTEEDVFDKAVIHRNPWLMYGSRKENQEAYKLMYIFDNNFNEIEHPQLNIIPKLLSIRNHKEATQINNDIKITNTYNLTNNSYKNRQIYDKIQDLVNILSPNRADNFNEWLELGFCLHNIDNDLLNIWVQFSKLSPKFVDGDCEKRWNKFKHEGLTIASLYRWAKLDSPEEYKKIKHNELYPLLLESLSGTNYDVAVVVHALFKHQFVNASIKHNKWYEFKDHRWQEMDKGLYLRKKISIDIANEYKELSQYYKKKMLEATSEEIENIKTKFKKCEELIAKVKSTSFKEKLMVECGELFYNSEFLNKLDSNVNLIGFQNGVYDLERGIFRDGLPDDYISYSTHIDYIMFDNTSDIAEEITIFLQQIVPSSSVRKYVLLLLSSFLSGKVEEQKFHIWTGSGANGKSTLIQLFEKSFGDYCGKLPITVLTQKRSGSSSATPEIAKTKGKRFVSLQEPEQNDQIHVGYMKELSGGDIIQARALYAEPVEFKPQFKIILACNDLPSIPSTDGGTWRRLRVVDFPSKFVDHTPVEKNEFKKDIKLSEKMNNWKETFISLLLHLHKVYQTEGIIEPNEVKIFTKEYQKSSDTIMEYLDEHIEITNNKKDTILLTTIMNHFRSWYKEMYSEKSPGRKIIKPYLEKFFGSQMKSFGWKGARLKIDDEICEDDIDENL